MSRQVVKNTEIPFTDLLALIDAIGTLTAGLEDLDRIKRGAISADSKSKVWKLVSKFIKTLQKVRMDDNLNLSITNIEKIAETIRDTGSEDGDGYKIIEKSFAKLLFILGFMKGIYKFWLNVQYTNLVGYLFVLYEVCRQNEPLKFKKGPDDDDDQATDNFAQALIVTETKFKHLKIWIMNYNKI